MSWPRPRGGAGGGPPPPASRTLQPGAPTLDAASEPADAELWSDEETHVRVDRLQGFLCKVSVHAKIDLNPAGVYAILTQPDNSEVFRSLESMPFRRVLSSDPHNPDKRTVEVEHVARWRAGPLLTGTLSTRLIVEEDPVAGTVRFRLAPGGPRGFMAAFEGAWTIEPMSRAGLGAVLAGRARGKGGGRGGGGGGGGGGGAAGGGGRGNAQPVAAAAASPPEASRLTYSWPWGVAEAALARVSEALPFTGGSGGGHGSPSRGRPSKTHPLPTTGASLVTLTQCVGPRLHIPPPIDRLVTVICARQVRGLLADLRAEAGRRRHRAAGDWADGGGGGGLLDRQQQQEWAVAPPPARRECGGRGRALLW